jgi:hypothetical protein
MLDQILVQVGYGLDPGRHEDPGVEAGLGRHR